MQNKINKLIWGRIIYTNDYSGRGFDNKWDFDKFILFNDVYGWYVSIRNDDSKWYIYSVNYNKINKLFKILKGKKFSWDPKNV